MNYPPSTSVIGCAPTQARPQTIPTLLEDFDPVFGRLEALANRAQCCADRLVGSRPSEVGKAETNPAPSHLMYAVQARRERLVRAVDYMESEIERIANAIGLERS